MCIRDRSRTVSAKIGVFRPLFWRKKIISPIWPPSVIHGWKATDLYFQMVKRIFFFILLKGPPPDSLLHSSWQCVVSCPLKAGAHLLRQLFMESKSLDRTESFQTWLSNMADLHSFLTISLGPMVDSFWACSTIVAAHLKWVHYLYCAHYSLLLHE